jgi:hypothetical protein
MQGTSLWDKYPYNSVSVDDDNYGLLVIIVTISSSSCSLSYDRLQDGAFSKASSLQIAS